MLRKKFVAEDLASNPDFREWVLNTNPDANSFWEDWAKESEENLRILKEAKILVLSFRVTQFPFNENDEDILWNKIEHTLRHENDASTVKDNEEQKFSPHLDVRSPGLNHVVFKWASIAALLIISIGIFWFFVRTDEAEKISQVSEPTMIHKQVSKGQKLKMHLPDGSKVVLNASSSISYPSKFDEHLREVKIEGEAYFEVKKDSLNPFHVKTRDMITEVLGTSFNVSAYKGTKDVKVTLVSGKVAVSSLKSASKIAIDPGEEVKIDTETGQMTKNKIKYPSELQWIDGILVFNNEPLDKVFKKLELWYGVDFHIQNIPPGKIVTGRFENEYLDNVLQSIQYTVNFTFEIDSNNVYVKF